MRYKYNDYVLVRSDLKLGQRYGSQDYVSGMDRYLGKIVRIRMLIPWAQCYMVEESCRVWTDEMFSGSIPYSNNLVI